MTAPTPPPPALPFGRHVGTPLGAVPLSYLNWLLRECKLSSGLRASVAAELTRRGFNPPPPAPPRPIAPCKRCGPGAGMLINWQECRNGTRRLRAECRSCRGLLTNPPSVEPYLGMANAAMSATPILDALTKLEDLGIELQSDGSRAEIAWLDRRRVPAELVALVRQCSHQLAGLLGDNRATKPTTTTAPTRGTP